MKKLVASLCLLSLSGFAFDKNDLSLLDNKRSIFRPGSPEFSSFKKKLESMSSKEISGILNRLSPNGTRNFLHILNQSKDKKVLLDWYLNALSDTPENKKQFLLFFSSRIITKSDIPVIITKAKENSHKPELLELIASTPSKEAFDYLKDLRNAKKEWLLTTVTPENFQTVLGLLQSRNEQAVDIAKRMLRLPMTSDFTRNELIYKIEKLYVPKKPKFSDEQINKLVSLIQSFNETTIEQLTSQQARILFDDETFPPDLYSEVYSKVSTSNPALMLLLKARCLGFSQANFKSFHQHIDALYSAKPKERKRTMLALKDSEDKSLLTVFKYLMQDPDPEIQFEAIHTVADIFNAYASDNKPLHLFPEEKEIRQLLYDSHDSVIVATLDLIDSMGHEGFPEELLKLSKHKNTEVKKAAIETIEGIEPEGGMKRLIELMEDNDWSIRQLAARAMKGYDNRSQYTSQIEKIYLKEKDPFVKETLFNYVKRSSNSAIGDFFRKMAGGLDAVKKENAMIKLFGMKAASYADIEKARKHFYKTKNPAFHKAWIEAASSRNFNIKPEIIHLLKSGTTAGLETGVSYAGEKRINLTDHLSEEKIALISGKTLLRYIQKNKSLKTKAKITLLKRVLQISEDYSLTSALTSFLGSLPRKQLKSQRNHSISVSSSRDLQFSQEELQELRQVLNQRLPKLKGTNLFISKLFIAVDGTDDYYQKWMSHKPQSSEKYFFAQAWSYLLNQKGTDFIQKYSESLANMISNLGISFYYFNEALPHMNAKDVLKIYTNAKEDYKDNLIKFVATAMTLAELQKEIKTLLDKDILSEYSLSEIFMAKLAKANAKEAQATLKLAKEYKIDNWQYMRLYQSISADVKKEMMQQAMQSSGLTPDNIAMAVKGIKASDSERYLEYLKKYDFPEIPWEDRENLKKLQKPLLDYIKKAPINEELIKVVLRAKSFLRVDPNLESKILNKISDYDFELQLFAFKKFEKFGLTQKDYYFKIYKKLLVPKVHKALFRPKDKEGDSSFSPFGHSYYEPREIEERPLKREIINLLKAASKKYENTQKIDLAVRLQNLVDINQYINHFLMDFSQNEDLLNFLPPGKISATTFDLIRQKTDLQKLPQRLTDTIAQSLQKEVSVKLVQEYQKKPAKDIYIYMLNGLDEQHSELIFSLLRKFINKVLTNQNEDYIHSEELNLEAQALIRRLPLSHKVQDAIYRQAVSKKLTFNEVYFLSLMGYKVPLNKLEEHLPNLKTETDKTALLEAAYISGSLSEKILKVHQEMLSDKDTQELKNLFSLSLDYTILERRQKDYISEPNSKEKLESLISDNKYERKAATASPKIQVILDKIDQLKYTIAKAKNNKTLMKYVKNNSDLTLKDLLEGMDGSDSGQIDKLTVKTLKTKISSSTPEEFKSFLNYLQHNTFYLDYEISQKFFNEMPPTHQQALLDWCLTTRSDNRENILTYTMHLASTEDQATKLINMVYNGEIQQYSLGTIRTKDKHLKTFRNVLYKLIHSKTVKLDQKGLSICATLGVNFETAALLDRELPTLDEELQTPALNATLSAGPYFPNSLKKYHQILENGEGHNLFFIDSSYIAAGQKLDLEKVKPVQEIFDKIAALKVKIYEKKNNPNPHTLIGLIHTPDYFKKEFEKQYKKANTSPWLIYTINLYQGDRFEQILKDFILTHIKQHSAPMVFKRYLNTMNLSYDWLPEELKKIKQKRSNSQ